VPSSTRPAYLIGSDDVGSTLRVLATASSLFGAAAAESASTALVSTLPLIRDAKSGLARQQVIGSALADFLAGTNAHELFRAGEGSDRIDGKGGSDLAYGGRGRDIITLANGADSGYGGKGRAWISSSAATAATPSSATPATPG
jgi:Ca2+-binding RTX toxin-like protein